MDISNITQTTQQAAKTHRSMDQALDRDAFMKILVAQLQNQDPLSPMDDRDFIAQVAQFSMLDEIQQLGQNFDQLKGMSFLGQMVTAVLGEEVVEGKVDAISLEGKEMLFHIGDRMIQMDHIIGVVHEN